MKAFRPVLLIVIGLVIGAVAGWFVAGHQCSKWVASWAADNTLRNLGEAYRVLKSLRSGDTNEGIEMLESRLDGEIMALSALASEVTDDKKRAGYMRALTRVRDYRIAHPRKTDSPEIDQGVADALASLGGEPGK